jgi:hypothetical protein
MPGTPNLKKYIGNAIIHLVSSGVSLELTTRNVRNNEFLEDEQKIVQRVQGEVSEWGPEFVHEYCHWLQWKDGRYRRSFYGEAQTDLERWIDRYVSFSKSELNLIINRIKRLELDCEKRAVKEIETYSLEIDKTRYIKRANAYIFGYNMIAETRKWYKSSPHFNKKILDIMPGRFLSRYDRTPKKYRELYLECCL